MRNDSPRWEEINRSRTGKGLNYGWPLLEGRHKPPGGGVCTSNCKTMPITEYSHSAFGGGNCAVTGGYVSRRSGATLYGKYVFGDYCSGTIWSLVARNGKATKGKRHPFKVQELTSFGENARGELFLVSQSGTIYRLAG